MRKKYFKLFSLALLGLLIVSISCSSSGTTRTYNNRENFKPEENWTLKDHLRRASGVRVTGSRGSLRVIIRGESSVVNPSTQPLFVIDGQKVGRDFSNVNQMLSPGEIKSIEVLPPSRAAQYGMEGNYGVIRIYTVNESS